MATDAPEDQETRSLRSLATWLIAHRGILATVVVLCTATGASVLATKMHNSDQTGRIEALETWRTRTETRLATAEHDAIERRAEVRAMTQQIDALHAGQLRIEDLLHQLLLRFTPEPYRGAQREQRHSQRDTRRSTADN